MMRHLLRRIRNTVGNERGNALIAALMITLVLTLLGLALFDLASLDARLALGNESDYRAMELAQSGIERALHQLFLDLCGNDPACPSSPAIVSWADNDINATAFPVSTGSFANFINSVGLPATGFADAVGFGGTGANVAYTSTYYVQLKNLIQSEANGLGIVCDAVDPVDPGSPCRDVIYVRATGNFTAGNVQSSTRTVQVIARATFNGLGGDGIVAGAPASGPILGSASIHGSVHIMPCGTNPCTPFTESGNSGIFNNYNGLTAALQTLVPRLPRITCPPGTACAGNTVETLNASVRIAKPDTGTVTIGGSGSIGESGAGTTNGVTGILGKPTVEGVFLGTGCTPTCTNVVDNPNKVHADKPIRGYDQNPPPTFPTLDNQATVFTRSYDDYAACSGPGVCNSSGAVVSGSGNDFFISHSAKIMSTTADDRVYTCPVGACTNGSPNPNLLALVSNGSWTDSTSTWRYTFTCGGGGVTCDDAVSNRVNGSINGSKPDGFQLEWNQATDTISVYKCPVGQTVPCGTVTPLSASTGSNITPGTRAYRVTYVDAGGVEFDVSPALSVTLPSTGPPASNCTPAPPTTTPCNVTLTAAAGPPGTVTRNVYRTTNALDTNYWLVGPIPDNVAVTQFVDNISDTDPKFTDPLVRKALSLNQGLLSDSDKNHPTLPILVYVDGRLRICDGCNSSKPSFFFRGNAIFVAKGNAADTIGSSNASFSIDTDLLPACAGACPVNNAFPQTNSFHLYTPGNIFMGDTAQRSFAGEFYAGGMWSTKKQTQLLGGVTARVFDLTGQVPDFWQVTMPRTATAFPPRAQRWNVTPVRWKECIGTLGSGAC